MCYFISIYTLVILFCCKIEINAKLPSYITLCKLSNEECLKSNIKNTISKLGDGDADLQILPLKKIKFNDMHLKSTSTMPQQDITNAFVHGLSDNIVVDTVRIDLDTCNINFNFRALNVSITYDVAIKGKYKSADVEFINKIVRNIETVNFPIYTNCKISERDGLRYINITNVAVDVTFDESMIKLSNEDDDVYKLILEDPRIYSTADLIWDDFFRDILNKIFNTIPVDELFQE